MDITGSISGILTTQLVEQTTSILTDINADLLAQTVELNGRFTQTNELITESKIEIKKQIDNFIENILKNKVIEAIKEWYKALNCEEIFNNISNYICDRIVGESYIKYDACNL